MAATPPWPPAGLICGINYIAVGFSQRIKNFVKWALAQHYRHALYKLIRPLVEES